MLFVRALYDTSLYNSIMKSKNLIKVSGSDVGEIELNAIREVFDRGYLGMGSDVKEFEEILENYLGNNVACVATGTAALHLGVQCCGIGSGDEVLVPSLTYLAAFQAISATGATPIPVDVVEESLTIDPESVRKKITKKTKAIMPVHYGGGIRRLDEIYSIGKENGLRIIEDAAHAFGSKIDGNLVGSGGDITCFSFDPIKNLTSGEGGCVVSSDKVFINYVKDARLLGVKGDSIARNSEQRLYEFQVESQGWRYHMSNINAAIGKAQFESFEYKINLRKHFAKLYNEIFRDSKKIKILPYIYEQEVPHIYVIRFKNKQTRDFVKKELLEVLNVQTALHWFPNHLLTRFSNNNESLPITEHAFNTMLTIPLHTKLTDEEVIRIAEFILLKSE